LPAERSRLAGARIPREFTVKIRQIRPISSARIGICALNR